MSVLSCGHGLGRSRKEPPLSEKMEYLFTGEVTLCGGEERVSRGEEPEAAEALGSSQGLPTV